jgi:hypothetical protein
LIGLKKAEQFQARFLVELGGRQRDVGGFDLSVAAVNRTGWAGGR